MEQLLVHCANAIQTNDATLAQQILWVLNNIAPPDGDSNQRLTCAFLRALVARAAKTGTCKLLAARYSTYNNLIPIPTHRFSIIELASFVDLTPWHRFGFTAANSAILDSIEGYSSVHLVDLSSTHCMQIPTLIDAISSRFDSPPLIRLTVAAPTSMEHHTSTTLTPPLLDLSYEELGSKLVNFARSRNLSMEFRLVSSSYLDGFQSLIDHLRIEHPSTEALVINCNMILHCLQDEVSSISISAREMFLKSMRSLEPTAVVVVEEDAELSGGNLVSRIRSAFNYFWIPFDAVEAFLPAGSRQRQWYEAEVCWRIENVIAQEGIQRVERGEGKSMWIQRMRNAAFRGVGFGEECVAEVRGMLGEHAAGWGLKKEEDDQHLVLTWKGHNVVFATAWIPSSSSSSSSVPL
ncbi:Scarecrow-like protein 32 [Linum perenne]